MNATFRTVWVVDSIQEEFNSKEELLDALQELKFWECSECGTRHSNEQSANDCCPEGE